jgi:hypothetical protein
MPRRTPAFIALAVSAGVYLLSLDYLTTSFLAFFARREA